jgi:hypothetical protein
MRYPGRESYESFVPIIAEKFDFDRHLLTWKFAHSLAMMTSPV